MTRNRIRHQNAYRAGIRDGVMIFLATLLAVTPRAAHAALQRIADRIVGLPEHQQIERDRT